MSAVVSVHALWTSIDLQQGIGEKSKGVKKFFRFLGVTSIIALFMIVIQLLLFIK